MSASLAKLKSHRPTTVNSEILARVLFSRNFTAKKGEITLSFTDIGNSCPSREYLTFQICILTLFAKIKFSRKFPDLQYADCLQPILIAIRVSGSCNKNRFRFINKNFQRKTVNIFLSIIFNKCFWCSKEPSH